MRTSDVPEAQVVSEAVAKETDIALPVRTGMRTYYSSHHLWAANDFSRLCAEIEEGQTGEAVFDIGHRALVTASVMSSAAFVEAVINEFFQDAADGHTGYLEPLSVEVIELLAGSWNLLEGRNRGGIRLLDKFQLALTLASAPQFETGRVPFQDAQLLVRLRNHLVHFKPETSWTDEESVFEKALSGKFSENRLMTGAKNPYFPDRCLGFGCTKWAVSAARALADAFFKRVGVSPNYQRVEFSRRIEPGSQN